MELSQTVMPYIIRYLKDQHFYYNIIIIDNIDTTSNIKKKIFLKKDDEILLAFEKIFDYYSDFILCYPYHHKDVLSMVIYVTETGKETYIKDNTRICDIFEAFLTHVLHRIEHYVPPENPMVIGTKIFELSDKYYGLPLGR